MKIRVCHITTVHGPFDGRIFQKECRTLAASGYHVFEVAPHCQDESVDGIEILGIRRIEQRWLRIFVAPWLAFRRALSVKSAIYHFHDAELIPVGIVLKLLGKVVIYDVHENLPAQITSKPWIRVAALKSVLAWLADVLERSAVVLFDAVISVIPEILERFPSRKCVLVRNLPVLSLVHSACPADIESTGVVCCYAGGLSRIRGIIEIIDAVNLTNNSVTLWLIGKWESDAFRRECEELAGYKHVKYFGVVSADAVFSYLKSADLGLVLLHPVANYKRSLPVKSFEYLACSLPVIMSDFPYFREIYANNVTYVNPQRTEDIARKIDWLVEHPDEAARQAAQGRATVEREFNWEVESLKLLDLYGRLTSRSAQATL